MSPVLHQETGSCVIWADADRLPAPRPAHFRAAWWQQQPGTVVQSEGRGSALMVRGPQGEAWVLREYLRGGLPGKVFHRRYLWRGEAQARPIREFSLLRQMRDENLPVPAPVGVGIWRHGLTWEGAMLMERIAHAESLAQRLAAQAFVIDAELPALDAMLERFFRAGYFHADLNLRNILRDAHGEWWLIDWDRGRSGVPPARCRNRLRRLCRSVAKIARAEQWPGDVPERLIRHWTAAARGPAKGAV